jgi:hypothetical protein
MEHSMIMPMIALARSPMFSMRSVVWKHRPLPEVSVGTENTAPAGGLRSTQAADMSLWWLPVYGSIPGMVIIPTGHAGRPGADLPTAAMC